MYCDGTKTTNVKCIYFDEENFRCKKQGYIPPKNLHLKKDNGKGCKQRRVTKDKEDRDNYLVVQERNSYIPKTIEKTFVNTNKLIEELVSGLTIDDREEYKSFLLLNETEQIFCFNIAVKKMHPADFAHELWGDVKNPKDKAKAVMRKPAVLKAIEELSKPDINLIKSSISSISMKALDVLQNNIEKLEYKELYDGDGNVIANNLTTIIEANERIANIYTKYNKSDENTIAGALLTFGDNTTLTDLLQESPKFKVKEVRNSVVDEE